MATLESCRAELNAIINELDQIEWDVRRSGQNVGEDKCADTINRINGRLRSAKYRLDHVNTNRLAQWIIDKIKG